ncbi:winged helix-turn-helix domain-containing protein [Deinococcus sp. YIM 134068]|uniref:winged helix-turn-helix domain-containing protein n=1 Tax=Deinococcus lichenicola TaxID=3118910 RepID=UPI002F9350E1
MTVTRRERGILEANGRLTAREGALYDLLAGHRGRLFSRAEIVERVWGLSFDGDDRIVDVYVKRIRHKLHEDVIETVRGAGYRCPQEPEQSHALPHFGQLSADARTVLELGRRMLGATTARGVLGEVRAVLAPGLGVASVALLAASRAPGKGWAVQDACGEGGVAWASLPVPDRARPAYPLVGGGRPVALLPLLGSGLGHWGTLAVAAQPGTDWDAGAYAQLEAVAALVNPALRLCLETELRQQAQRELQALNAELERRVHERTEALTRAHAEQEVLGELSRRLERAHRVPEVLAASLPVLARLAGTNACSAWFPGAAGGAALACHRVDGPVTPAAPAEAGGGVRLRFDVNGDELLLHAHDGAGQVPGPGRVSPLLHTAAQSVALTFSRLLYLAALESTALTDETTGLGNRQAFLADLTGEVAYSARHGAGFGLSVVEIANIRFLNATVGYAGGNDSIARLAGRLRGTRRTEDRVYRLGGATFAVLLRFPPRERPAAALAGWRERLRAALEELSGHGPPLELWTSEVSCPEDGQTPSDLLRRALDGLRPGLPAPTPDRRRHVDAHG